MTESDLEKLVSQIRKEREGTEAELQSQVADLEKQLADKQLALQTSRSESQRLKADLEKIKTDHGTEIAEKILQVEELQQKSAKLEASLSRTRAETQTLETRLRDTIGTLENQLTQREQELQASQSETQQVKTASEQMQTAYKDELAEKIQLVENLQNKSAELGQTLAHIKAEAEALETDLRATIKSLEGQLSQWKHDLQVSREEVQKLHRTITLLENDRDTLSQKSEDLDRQLLTSRNQIEGMQKTVADQKTQLAEAAQARQALVKENNVLQKERDELQRLRNALKNQLGLTQSQIEGLSAEAEAKESQLKSKEKQLKSLQEAYQELSKQFESQIREKEIEINSLQDKLNIRLLDKILFASGSAEITSIGHRVLESLATELKKMEGFEIAVEGHTDNKLLGPKLKSVYHDNLGLSVVRAAAVSRALEEMGVSPDNLSAVGYSMYRPVASNATVEGRQQNRRVEIMIEPLR